MKKTSFLLLTLVSFFCFYSCSCDRKTIIIPDRHIGFIHGKNQIKIMKKGDIFRSREYPNRFLTLLETEGIVIIDNLEDSITLLQTRIKEWGYKNIVSTKYPVMFVGSDVPTINIDHVFFHFFQRRELRKVLTIKNCQKIKKELNGIIKEENFPLQVDSVWKEKFTTF